MQYNIMLKVLNLKYQCLEHNHVMALANNNTRMPVQYKVTGGPIDVLDII